MTLYIKPEEVAALKELLGLGMGELWDFDDTGTAGPHAEVEEVGKAILARIQVQEVN